MKGQFTGLVPDIDLFSDFVTMRNSISLGSSLTLSKAVKDQTDFMYVLKTLHLCNIERRLDFLTREWAGIIGQAPGLVHGITLLRLTVLLRLVNTRGFYALILNSDIQELVNATLNSHTATRKFMWKAWDRLKTFHNPAYLVSPPKGIKGADIGLWMADILFTKEFELLARYVRFAGVLEWGRFADHMTAITCIGRFLAYEVYTDLTYLKPVAHPYLDGNMGPGSTGGLETLRQAEKRPVQIGELIKILRDVRNMQTVLVKANLEMESRLGPARPHIPAEVCFRTAVHALCEFNKFCRGLGIGSRPKGRLRYYK